jgi:transmembrane sensor
LFTVAHDEARPFMVHTADARITDLGTVFSVRTDADGSVRAAVTEGVVILQAVGAADSGLTLSPGEAGGVRRGAVARLPDGVVPADTSWTGGQLVLTGASIEEVTRTFHRWYGATLRVELPDSARHLSATLPPDSREQAARIVALSLGVRASWSGDTVTLRAAGRP